MWSKNTIHLIFKLYFNSVNSIRVFNVEDDSIIYKINQVRFQPYHIILLMAEGFTYQVTKYFIADVKIKNDDDGYRICMILKHKKYTCEICMHITKYVIDHNGEIYKHIISSM